jgi:PEP-CTERM motif
MIAGIRHVVCGTIFSFLGLAAMASTANAAVIWDVSGTFSDGTTLTGSFTTNVYGYVETWDLFTQAKGAFTSVEYDPSTSYRSSGFQFVDFQPGYFGDLHLDFAGNLTDPSSSNPILAAGSFECQGSYGCFIPEGGNTRYLTGGASDFAAAVPEPATWTMLILGFGMMGAALRLSGRRKILAAA